MADPIIGSPDDYYGAGPSEQWYSITSRWLRNAESESKAGRADGAEAARLAAGTAAAKWMQAEVNSATDDDGVPPRWNEVQHNLTLGDEAWAKSTPNALLAAVFYRSLAARLALATFEENCPPLPDDL